MMMNECYNITATFKPVNYPIQCYNEDDLGKVIDHQRKYILANF
jgi:hypothetical protein